jgi:putative transposase
MSKSEKIKVAYNVYKTSDDYKEACRLTGISPRTYYRWRIKLKYFGLQGTIKRLGKWSYGKKPANKTPDQIRHKVEVLRREDNYGTVKMAEILERDFDYRIHPDTIGRILREKGLNKTTKKYPTRSKGVWDKVIPYYPGDLVQADPVQFGELWIVNLQDTLIKWRSAVVVESLTVECIKDHIGLALESFPFEIRNLQWDNGSETEKDFPEVLKDKYGIQLRHTAPASPWQNGMIERLNRVTRDEEFGIARFKRTEKEKLQEKVDEKVKKYNEYRPHWSLGLKTPLKMWEDCLNNEYLKDFVKIAVG